MSIKMLAGVGVAVVALTAVGSGAALALSGRDLSAPSAAQSSAKSGASPQVGCLAGTIDGTVLTEAKQHEFVASGAKVVLYQEPAVDGQPRRVLGAVPVHWCGEQRGEAAAVRLGASRLRRSTQGMRRVPRAHEVVHAL